MKKYEIAGRYEDAAKLCDELEMWEKAAENRRMVRTSYQISTNFNLGKDGTFSVKCPNYSAAHIVDSKTNLVTCKYCGNNYITPKEVLDMM
jgi:ribosomal protein S27E